MDATLTLHYRLTVRYIPDGYSTSIIVPTRADAEETLHHFRMMLPWSWQSRINTDITLTDEPVTIITTPPLSYFRIR